MFVLPLSFFILFGLWEERKRKRELQSWSEVFVKEMVGKGKLRCVLCGGRSETLREKNDCEFYEFISIEKRMNHCGWLEVCPTLFHERTMDHLSLPFLSSRLLPLSPSLPHSKSKKYFLIALAILREFLFYFSPTMIEFAIHLLMEWFRGTKSHSHPQLRISEHLTSLSSSTSLSPSPSHSPPSPSRFLSSTTSSPPHRFLSSSQSTFSCPTTPRPKRLIVFTYGGAWGSGSPSLYTRFAKRLSSLFLCEVRVLYYDTRQPCVQSQVREVASQMKEILLEIYGEGNEGEERESSLMAKGREKRGSKRYGEELESMNEEKVKEMTEVVWIGHSAGSHLLLQALLTQIHVGDMERGRGEKELPEEGDLEERTSGGGGKKLWRVEKWRDIRKTKMLLMCGVFDINAHYHWESLRGVEGLSTMTTAMGGVTFFSLFSPLSILEELKVASPSIAKKFVCECLPSSVSIVHGLHDATVPLTSSALLFSCLTSVIENARNAEHCSPSPSTLTLPKVFFLLHPRLCHSEFVLSFLFAPSKERMREREEVEKMLQYVFASHFADGCE